MMLVMLKHKTPPSKSKAPPKATVTLLALRAQCSEATARKALAEGVDAIKGEYLRERLRAALV
jgi:hypothetical protein